MAYRFGAAAAKLIVAVNLNINAAIIFSLTLGVFLSPLQVQAQKNADRTLFANLKVTRPATARPAAPAKKKRVQPRRARTLGSVRGKTQSRLPAEFLRAKAANDQPKVDQYKAQSMLYAEDLARSSMLIDSQPKPFPVRKPPELIPFEFTPFEFEDGSGFSDADIKEKYELHRAEQAAAYEAAIEKQRRREDAAYARELAIWNALKTRKTDGLTEEERVAAIDYAQRTKPYIPANERSSETLSDPYDCEKKFDELYRQPGGYNIEGLQGSVDGFYQTTIDAFEGRDRARTDLKNTDFHDSMTLLWAASQPNEAIATCVDPATPSTKNIENICRVAVASAKDDPAREGSLRAMTRGFSFNLVFSSLFAMEHPFCRAPRIASLMPPPKPSEEGAGWNGVSDESAASFYALRKNPCLKLNLETPGSYEHNFIAHFNAMIDYGFDPKGGKEIPFLAYRDHFRLVRDVSLTNPTPQMKKNIIAYLKAQEPIEKVRKQLEVPGKQFTDSDYERYIEDKAESQTRNVSRRLLHDNLFSSQCLTPGDSVSELLIRSEIEMRRILSESCGVSVVGNITGQLEDGVSEKDILKDFKDRLGIRELKGSISSKPIVGHQILGVIRGNSQQEKCGVLMRRHQSIWAVMSQTVARDSEELLHGGAMLGNWYKQASRKVAEQNGKPH